MNVRFTALAVLAACLLAACQVTPPIPMADEAAIQASQQKPVLLMSVTLRNDYMTAHQPKLDGLWIKRRDVGDRVRIAPDEMALMQTSQRGNTYLLRFALEPGNYLLDTLGSVAPVGRARGEFITRMYTSFKVPQSGVHYLGHVNATVRKRNDGETPAGPRTPIVEQEVVGAGSGTFDVVISDRLAQDSAAFRKLNPALNGRTVQKAILPPYDATRIKRIVDSGEAS